MWISILLAASIGGCPSIKVKYHEDEGFTSKDQTSMRTAELRCKKMTQRICMKEFRKVKNETFNVICGDIPSEPQHTREEGLCGNCHQGEPKKDDKDSWGDKLLYNPERKSIVRILEVLEGTN